MSDPIDEPTRTNGADSSGSPDPGATGAGTANSPDAASGPDVAAAPSEAAPVELADPGDSSLLALIDRLAGMLDRTELSELEVQVGSTGLVLRKPSALAPVPAPTLVAETSASAAATPAAQADGSVPADAGPPARPSVKAPLTGIWYGSPAPGSAPYVSAGGEVVVGQVIGLIEAMKLFNEIKSDASGTVTRIIAESGALVKAKAPLIELDTA
jgi:acetyl-CoA carboxylase biotin carboxyl carrier protein